MLLLLLLFVLLLLLLLLLVMFTLFLLLDGHFPQYGILLSSTFPYYGQHFNAMELTKTMEMRFSNFFCNIPKIFSYYGLSLIFPVCCYRCFYVFIFRCCFCCCQYIVDMFLFLLLPSMLVHSYTQQVKLHNCEDHFHLDVLRYNFL